MELLQLDIASLSYKDVKLYIDNIDIFEERKNENIFKLIDKLSSDKIKNVKALAEKIKKEISK